MSLDRASLRKKRSARLAAIQGIYNLAITGSKKPTEKLYQSLMDQWSDSIASQDEEWPSDDMPDTGLLRKLLDGVTQHQHDIDEALKSVVKENWKPERMDPVILAALRCAIYELQHHLELDKAVILDEYVSIAKGFTDDAELGFVHSALQSLATQLRQAS